MAEPTGPSRSNKDLQQREKQREGKPPKATAAKTRTVLPKKAPPNVKPPGPLRRGRSSPAQK